MLCDNMGKQYTVNSVKKKEESKSHKDKNKF